MPSNDFQINEYFIATYTAMIPIYCSPLNKILDTGIMPDTWLEGIIIPLYKNKGSASYPANYRPITILSCLGKLFTAILNERLGIFLDNYMLLAENQAGFRKG